MQRVADVSFHNDGQENNAKFEGYDAVEEVLNNNNLTNKYELDEDLSTKQVLVFKDLESGKGVLVFRGAQAGHTETQSGQEANARDQNPSKVHLRIQITTRSACILRLMKPFELQSKNLVV